MNGNTWIGYGRFTKDPEVKTAGSDSISVVSFSLAINRPTNKDREHPEADFIDCVAWRQTADFIGKYFKKGMRIAISGRLQTRIWEDNNGGKHKATEVVVENASFIDPKSTNSNADNSSKSQNTSQSTPPAAPPIEFDDSSDDLPF